MRRTLEEKQNLVESIETEIAGGMKAKVAAKKHGISYASYYALRKKLAGQFNGVVRQIKTKNGNDERHLKIENQRLKMIVAEQALDIQALKEWAAR